jgi:hypothetical protein
MKEQLIKMVESLIFLCKSSVAKDKARKLMAEFEENYVIVDKEYFERIEREYNNG